MTTKLYRILTALFVCLFASLVLAQETQLPESVVSSRDTSPPSLRSYGLSGLDTKVTLDTLVDWEVTQILEYLARKGNLNIVVGKNVGGLAAKMKFKDVSVCDAMEIVLSLNGLAFEVRNGIVTIMTDEEYQALNGVSFHDKKQVKILKLKYADPIRMLPMLEKMKSASGSVVADSVTGNLILIDTPQKIAEIEHVVEKADISTITRVLPTETKTFTLQYANLDDVLPQVTAMITKEGNVGAVQSDQRTRSLIVTDMPHKLAQITDLITVFDRQPKQVFIEAKVIEIGLDDNFSLGINWQHLFQGLDPRFSFQAVSRPGASSAPAMSLTYNTIVSGGDLEIVFDALKSMGDTKILSNPQIAVLDGEEAQIEVIEDQPYKETTIESGTTNITGVTYLFKKVGVQLAVTPRINDDGFINVAIKPEISSISQWYDGAPQEGTPVIRKAHAETTVLVKDGVTIIIGGLIKDRKDVAESTVPILGSIPLLGRLFKYDATSIQNTETVVFLTPRIIMGDQPFLRMKDIKKAPKPMRTIGDTNGKPMKPVR